MGLVRLLRLDAELFGAERKRDLHPKALVRSNHSIQFFAFPACVLHIQHIGLSFITLARFLAKCPIRLHTMLVQ